MSAAQKGKAHSAETRAKLSAAQKGKPRSAETQAKMADTKRNRFAAKHGVPVDLLDDFRLYRRKRYTTAEAKAALGVLPSAGQGA